MCIELVEQHALVVKERLLHLSLQKMCVITNIVLDYFIGLYFILYRKNYLIKF